MAPRRRANRARNGTPRRRAPKYVSIFGSPKAPAPTPIKRQSTPSDQWDSDPPSEWSSPDQCQQPVRSTITAPTAAASAAAPATQRPETNRIASPQRVARAFEPESFHRLSETPPVSAGRPTQHQSCLPPSTDARKAPRKATIPTLPIPGPSYVGMPQSEPTEARELLWTSNSQPTPAFPAFKSLEKCQEAEVALDVKVRDCKTAELPTPIHHTQPVLQPRRPTHPQPKFTYNLTSELEGIKRALGEDNWTEYVVLVEKRESGEIDGTEFEKLERSIFQTPSIPGLQKMVREMVARRMSGGM